MIMLRQVTHDSSHQNLSRFSSQVFEGLNGSSPTSKPEGHRSQASHSSGLSVHEDSNQFLVSLEFSQYDETSLDLWIEDHQLTLIADERPQFFSEGQRPASFFSSIDLPSDVDEDSIKAELINAQLKIRFTKERANSSTDF
jgi:HSP20 family molecular chaperone IbpA